MFIGLFTYGVWITFGTFLGKNPVQAVVDYSNERNENPVLVDKCSDKPALDLAGATVPEIVRLDEHQKVCKSFVTDEIMTFALMPKDKTEAVKMADTMAIALKEYSKYGIKPLVIIEPEASWGLIDFLEFERGFYNPFLTLYFNQLRANGITDSMMGTWVPFPEANTPLWNKQNSTPKDFVGCINIYLGILRSYYPTAKTSILLNSATYPNEDTNYLKGEYVSLIPYLDGIKPGLVDSFGMQGFPWSPAKGENEREVNDIRVFLPSRLLEEAADKLAVKEVWINTGTYSTKYTNNADITVYVAPEARKAILKEIITLGKDLQAKGYTVKVNLFNEDKSETAEATDWSYFLNADNITRHTVIYVEMMALFSSSGIQFSQFDI